MFSILTIFNFNIGADIKEGFFLLISSKILTLWPCILYITFNRFIIKKDEFQNFDQPGMNLKGLVQTRQVSKPVSTKRVKKSDQYQPDKIWIPDKSFSFCFESQERKRFSPDRNIFQQYLVLSPIFFTLWGFEHH